MVRNSTIPTIEYALNAVFQFRRNTVLNRIEYKLISENHFRILGEVDLNSIFRLINTDEYLSCTKSLLENILNSDFVPDQDPFFEYFSNLPKWKYGDQDYIQELASTIKTDNDEFWNLTLKKWIVATVACAVSPDKINHQVLVLVGDQGIGKSTWLNNLLPKSLSGYIYTGLVNPNNKDTLLNLSENLLINLDELENLNKSEIGSLKALITQNDIRARRAYGVFNENYIRRASFMGSVNDSEFLTDTTGNRRFLCHNCQSIDYKKKINMDKVYAQAFALYNSGFKYYFDVTDIHMLEKQNENFLRASVEEELLLKYFKNPEKDDTDASYMTATEIVTYIDTVHRSRLVNNVSLKKIGQALQKHKFPRKSGNSKPYKVVIVPIKQLDKAA